MWDDTYGGTVMIILFLLVLLYEIRGLNIGIRVVLYPPRKMEPTQVMGLIHLYGKDEDASRS